ncbi:hypothetical protein B5E65_13500 [Gemmiger sp. An120]|uniref:HdeD family acid-resistance protein n=1 Tax=Gemmiger sp. An120 TaxID=1965549 RepID=UPI000B366022|nr:DUF308 domain-containing protein [Gemmiger sp. An120]OUQ41131.1 hypothetical protein B5E65_13500 [Gemmiger sp. An120]HIX34688.1 DUF308 domain-containing protein [Candidatus Gemmiger avium]
MFRHLKASMFVMQLVYLALGLALVFAPDMSARVLCYACGAALLAVGLLAVWRFAAARQERLLFAWFSLVYGVLFTVLGIFLLVQPDTVLTVLPAVFGVFVLLDSLGRIQNALELRRAGLVRWWGMLFFALLSVVLGVLILINPFAALTTTVRVIGAVLLIESVLGLACALYTSLVLRELEKAVRDAGDDLMEV